MLWWEGRHGGERHHARHRTHTSTASADPAGSRGGGGWHRRGLPTVSRRVGTGVPAAALPAHQLQEPPLSQEGGEQEKPVCAQPTVDRSPFRKRGLSPSPLQQAVKSLASQEIKRRPRRRANRGWEGLSTKAMAEEERVNGYPCSWHIWQPRSMPCPV